VAFFAFEPFLVREFAMDQRFQDSFPAASRFLQTCEDLTTDIKVEPFAIVLFGGAGDLSRRMLLPSLYHLRKDGRLPEDFSIVGFGLPEMSDDQFRNLARESVERFSRELLKRNSGMNSAGISFISLRISPAMRGT
jgi:hypothetical protein